MPRACRDAAVPFHIHGDWDTPQAKYQIACLVLHSEHMEIEFYENLMKLVIANPVNSSSELLLFRQVEQEHSGIITLLCEYGIPSSSSRNTV